MALDTTLALTLRGFLVLTTQWTLAEFSPYHLVQSSQPSYEKGAILSSILQ